DRTVTGVQTCALPISEQFEEIFRESGQTLEAEIGNLKSIVARFSDFSKMPTPELQPVSVNDSLRQAALVYEPQFCAKGRPLITRSEERRVGKECKHRR